MVIEWLYAAKMQTIKHTKNGVLIHGDIMECNLILLILASLAQTFLNKIKILLYTTWLYFVTLYQAKAD